LVLDWQRREKKRGKKAVGERERRGEGRLFSNGGGDLAFYAGKEKRGEKGVRGGGRGGDLLTLPSE